MSLKLCFVGGDFCVDWVEEAPFRFPSQWQSLQQLLAMDMSGANTEQCRAHLKKCVALWVALEYGCGIPTAGYTLPSYWQFASDSALVIGKCKQVCFEFLFCVSF